MSHFKDKLKEISNCMNTGKNKLTSGQKVPLKLENFPVRQFFKMAKIYSEWARIPRQLVLRVVTLDFPEYFQSQVS